MPQLRRVAPLKSIDDDSHEAARDSACNRKSDDPAHVNPRNHSPVDSSLVTVALVIHWVVETGSSMQP